MGLSKNEKGIHPEFADGFDEGYENFKIGVLFKVSREQPGMTQEEVAQKVGTKKISDLANREPCSRYSAFYAA